MPRARQGCRLGAYVAEPRHTRLRLRTVEKFHRAAGVALLCATFALLVTQRCDATEPEPQVVISAQPDDGRAEHSLSLLVLQNAKGSRVATRTAGVCGASIIAPIIANEVSANVTFVLDDDQGSKGRALLLVVRAISDWPDLVGIVGAAFSSVSATVEPLVSNFELPMVSQSATSPALSDKFVFPFFSRVVAPDTKQAAAAAELISEFGWRAVAVIHSDDSYGVGGSSAFASEAVTAGLQIVSEQQVLAGQDEVQLAVRNVADSQAQVVFLVMTSDDLIRVMTEAVRQDLVRPERVWIALDGAKSLWGGLEDPNTLTALGSSEDEFRKIAHGLIYVNLPSGFGPGFDAFETEWSAMPDSVCPPAADGGIPSGNNAAVVHDAMQAYRHAFAALHSRGELGDILGDDRDGTVLLREIRRLDFPGATGQVRIDEATGDRSPAAYDIWNLGNTDAVYPTLVGRWSESTGLSLAGFPSIKFALNQTTPPAPYGTVEVALPPALVTLITIAAPIIISASILSMFFLFHFREEPTLKSSHVHWMLICLFGIVMVCSWSLVLLLTPNVTVCKISIWMGCMGILLTLQPLVLKAVRYCRLARFRSETSRGTMIAGFMASIVVTSMLLLLWTGVSDLVGVQTKIVFNPPNKRFDVTTQCVLSGGKGVLENPYMMTITIATLVLLFVASTMHTMSLSKIRDEHVDAKFLGNALFVASTVCLVGVPVVVLLEEDPDSLSIAACMMVYITLASTLYFTVMPHVDAISSARNAGCFSLMQFAIHRCCKRRRSGALARSASMRSMRLGGASPTGKESEIALTAIVQRSSRWTSKRLWIRVLQPAIIAVVLSPPFFGLEPALALTGTSGALAMMILCVWVSYRITKVVDHSRKAAADIEKAQVEKRRRREIERRRTHRASAAHDRSNVRGHTRHPGVRRLAERTLDRKLASRSGTDFQDMLAYQQLSSEPMSGVLQATASNSGERGLSLRSHIHQMFVDTALGTCYHAYMMVAWLLWCASFIYGTYVVLEYSSFEESAGDAPDGRWNAANMSVLHKVVELGLICTVSINYCFLLYLASNKMAFILRPSHIADLVSLFGWIPVLKGEFFFSPVEGAPPDQRFFTALLVTGCIRFFRLLTIVDFAERFYGTSTGTRSVKVKILEVLLLILGIMCFLAGFTLITETEQDVGSWQFHDMLYFAMVSMSTVGYGDVNVYHSTTRVVLLFTIGLTVVVVPEQASRIVSLMSMSRKIAELPSQRDRDVVMVVGALNADRFQLFLDEFYHADHGYVRSKVTLLSPLSAHDEHMKILLKRSAWEGKVSFYSGSPLDQSDLYDVAAAHAQAAFLVSATDDDGLEAVQTADTAVIVQALTLRQVLPITARFYVQLIGRNADARSLLYRNGVRNVICVNELRGKLLSRAATCPGLTALLSNLIRSQPERKPALRYPQWMTEYMDGQETEIYASPLPKTLHQTSYGPVAELLFAHFNITLIAVKLNFSMTEEERRSSLSNRPPVINESDEEDDAHAVSPVHEDDVLGDAGDTESKSDAPQTPRAQSFSSNHSEAKRSELSFLALNPGPQFPLHSGDELFFLAHSLQDVQLAVATIDRVLSVDEREIEEELKLSGTSVDETHVKAAEHLKKFKRIVRQMQSKTRSSDRIRREFLARVGWAMMLDAHADEAGPEPEHHTTTRPTHGASSTKLPVPAPKAPWASPGPKAPAAEAPTSKPLTPTAPTPTAPTPTAPVSPVAAEEKVGLAKGPSLSAAQLWRGTTAAVRFANTPVAHKFTVELSEDGSLSLGDGDSLSKQPPVSGGASGSATPPTVAASGNGAASAAPAGGASPAAARATVGGVRLKSSRWGRVKQKTVFSREYHSRSARFHATAAALTRHADSEHFDEGSEAVSAELYYLLRRPRKLEEATITDYTGVFPMPYPDRRGDLTSSRFFSGIHADASHDEREATRHIIVSGSNMDALYDFVLPLRTRLNAVLRPLVIVHPQGVSAADWEMLAFFPELYILKGSMEVGKDLVRADVANAKSVVLMGRSTGGKNVLRQLDMHTVMALNSIETLVAEERRRAALAAAEDPSAMPPPLAFGRSASAVAAAKLVEEKSHYVANIVAEFMTDGGFFLSDGPGYDHSSLVPSFAAGRVCSTSLFQELVVQGYHSPPSMALVQEMVTGPVGPVLAGVQSIVKQIDLPSSVERGARYRSLFRTLVYDSGSVPMGLYRFSEETGQYYVMTNPDPATLLLPTDKVFVLAPFSEHAT